MGRRDVQTQFAEKEDAIQPKAYKDAAIGGPSNEKSVSRQPFLDRPCLFD